MRKAALFPDEANHIPDAPGQSDRVREGQSDRVRMSQTWDIAPGLLSLSPHGRLSDKQNSNIHGTVKNQHPLIGGVPD